MAKRRSCRRTEDESRIHEKAVKWRKMTDEQLVHYVEDRANKSYSEGYNAGVEEGRAEPTPGNMPKGDAGEFIRLIQSQKIPGIGAVTVSKILKLAKENGFISQ